MKIRIYCVDCEIAIISCELRIEHLYDLYHDVIHYHSHLDIHIDDGLLEYYVEIISLD